MVYVRNKDWSPTIYTVASTAIETLIMQEAHFRVIRKADELVVIDYDTTDNSTLLSYDADGNFFELDMSMFEPGYMYEISFMFKQNGQYREQEDKFSFRVD